MRHAGARRTIVVVLAAAAAAGLPAAAQAATPFNVGAGDTPQVAVDSTGAGHIVWDISSDAGARIGYCRVPKNATACDVARELSFPGGGTPGSFGYPQVFAPAPNKVVIVGGCYSCGSGYPVYRWISVTNGASFGSSVQVADNIIPEGEGTYVNTGDVAVVISGENILGTPAVGSSPVGVLAGGHNVSESVVRVPGHNQLVAAGTNHDAISYSVFSGPLTPSAINTPSNWTAARPPTPPVDDSPALLGAGGAGVFLAFHRYATKEVMVQRYDPATKAFGAPSPIDSSGGSEIDVAVDSAGPHVMWDTDFDGGRLRYRRSTDAGASYGPVANIATRDTFSAPKIAVAADGSSGFATWISSGGTIKAVALDPQPEPSTITTPAPQPPATPPPPPPPPILPKATTKKVTVSDRYTSYSLSVPSGCVAPGQSFTATLRWKRKKRKGNVVVKVARVDFYLDKKRLKIDRKAPFAYRYRIAATKRPGSTIKLRARAFTKVRRGKAPKKSLNATIRVCS